MRLFDCAQTNRKKVYLTEKYKAQGLIKVCLKFYDKACKRFVIKIEDFDSEAFDHRHPKGDNQG